MQALNIRSGNYKKRIKWKSNKWKEQYLKWKLHWMGLTEWETSEERVSELKEKSIEMIQSED